MEAKQTAQVFEEFVASFQETESSGKTFVRGSSSIKPAATGKTVAAKCADLVEKCCIVPTVVANLISV